jgi:hypothetical protein
MAYFYATNARKETSSYVNYYLECPYNPLSDSSHCRNWMTYAVRATGFFQDTEYFLQLPVVFWLIITDFLSSCMS